MQVPTHRPGMKDPLDNDDSSSLLSNEARGRKNKSLVTLREELNGSYAENDINDIDIDTDGRFDDNMPPKVRLKM